MTMAAATTRSKRNDKKYSNKAGEKVRRAMDEMKAGTLRSGGSGKKVKSRKQAIAIGLSEARRDGARVPAKTLARKTGRTNRRSSARA
jgi:Family of unknown function (DUF6496)